MISKDEVKHIAELARIGMNEEELDKMSFELSAVLDWIKQLEEVDVKKVSAVSHVTGLASITREDYDKDFGNKEEIKKLFPEEKGGYDKVKSVL